MEGGSLSRPMRILVADDEPANVEFLVEVLSAEGYSVESAHDGREALERALAAPPDLVLLDVSMPRLTGLEACRLLKDDESTHLVPVVLITGLTAREDRIRGLQAGCDDFLTKPVGRAQLRAMIASYLDRPES
jgi:CheY-like chemotaxis protein